MSDEKKSANLAERAENAERGEKAADAEVERLRGQLGECAKLLSDISFDFNPEEALGPPCGMEMLRKIQALLKRLPAIQEQKTDVDLIGPTSTPEANASARVGAPTSGQGPSPASPTKSVREAANDYVSKTEGDDCLCQRSVPGTPVGEHLYVGCCCKIADAFSAGAHWSTRNELSLEDVLKRELKDDALVAKALRAVADAIDVRVTRSDTCSHAMQGSCEKCGGSKRDEGNALKVLRAIKAWGLTEKMLMGVYNFENEPCTLGELVERVIEAEQVGREYVDSSSTVEGDEPANTRQVAPGGVDDPRSRGGNAPTPGTASTTTVEEKTLQERKLEVERLRGLLIETQVHFAHGSPDNGMDLWSRISDELGMDCSECHKPIDRHEAYVSDDYGGASHTECDAKRDAEDTRAETKGDGNGMA